MVADIDLHVGRRLRRRRHLLGLTQQQLASATGVRFQQIQKYECAANKMSAARLWQLSAALEVPISYFYDGLSNAAPSDDGHAPRHRDESRGEVFTQKETLDLVQAYYRLDERPRRKLLDLALSLNSAAAG